MLAFERPQVLALLILIPVFIALGRKMGPRFSFSLHNGLSFSALSPLVRFAGIARSICFWFGFSLLVLAAAGPARVEHELLYLSHGSEIIFVLDISPSMAASDVKPTRLDAAKLVIKRFIGGRRNETVGLVAFGGEAALVCPPTADYRVLVSRLQNLKAGDLGEGSAIGSGLGTALAHTLHSDAPGKYIVLLTDGENNSGSMSPETAADLAARKGVRVFVVGIGSRGDVPVNYFDPATGKRSTGVLRSSFNEAGLELLARKGEGEYYSASTADALASAFASISERSSSLLRTRSISTERPLVLPLLAFALLFLLLARLLDFAFGGGSL